MASCITSRSSRSCGGSTVRATGTGTATSAGDKTVSLRQEFEYYQQNSNLSSSSISSQHQHQPSSSEEESSSSSPLIVAWSDLHVPRPISSVSCPMATPTSSSLLLLGEGTFSQVFKVHLALGSATSHGISYQCQSRRIISDNCGDVVNHGCPRRGAAHEDHDSDLGNKDTSAEAVSAATASPQSQESHSSPYLPPSPANNRDDSYYALKCLKRVQYDDVEFTTACYDLMVEAHILSHLHHPNIIRIHGMSSTLSFLSSNLSHKYEPPWSLSPTTLANNEYFLLLDVMEETLEDRLQCWRLIAMMDKLHRISQQQPQCQPEEEGSRRLWQRRNTSSSGLRRGKTSRGGRRNPMLNMLQLLPGSSQSKSVANSYSRSIPETSANSDTQSTYSASSSSSLSPTLKQQRHLHRLHQQRSHCSIPSLLQRLESIALGIARGMEYIHDHEIIYRDLKPSNIGFNAKDGTVQIFDFGKSRELHLLKKKTTDGNCYYREEYHQTEFGVGTLRYMDIDAMFGIHIGKSNDVYSYALVLYELCTLLMPYPDTTNNTSSEATGDSMKNGKLKWLSSLVSFVTNHNNSSRSYRNQHQQDPSSSMQQFVEDKQCTRPCLKHLISTNSNGISINGGDDINVESLLLLSELIRSCWAFNHRGRPSFGTIVSSLERILTSLPSTDKDWIQQGK